MRNAQLILECVSTNLNGFILFELTPFTTMNGGYMHAQWTLKQAVLSKICTYVSYNSCRLVSTTTVQ